MTLSRLELSNGAVLLLRENHANASISLRGSAKAGSSYGPMSVPEFAARLLLRGTTRRSAARVSRAIEDVGAALSAECRHESVAFHGRCTRETLKATLDILTESLASPAFAATEMRKVRGEIVGDLREEQDDTRITATHRLFQVLYPKGHPYREGTKGSEEAVSKVGRRDVRAHHDARFGASGMVFAFSGDLTEDDLNGVVAPAFERLDAGTPPTPLRTPRTRKPAHAIVRMPHKSQADFIVGRVALPRKHPDHQALSLATLLFGRIGLYGRLGMKVRDELGLAYYSFAFHEARLAGGHWYANAGVNPKNVARAAKAIRNEMLRLESEPFTRREIRDGKSHVLGSLQVYLERNAEYASALHDMEYFDLGIDYLERLPGIIRRLPGDRVRDVAAEHYDPDESSWVASGPLRGVKIKF